MNALPMIQGRFAEVAALRCNLELGLTKPFGLVRVKVPP